MCPVGNDGGMSRDLNKEFSRRSVSTFLSPASSMNPTRLGGGHRDYDDRVVRHSPRTAPALPSIDRACPVQRIAAKA